MSGSTIGGVVGGVIGFYVGGPQGAQIGWMLGSAVGGYVDPQHLQGPKLGDIPIQTSQEGVPRPIVYGSPQPFPGNLIQAGPKIKVATHERQGKGGPVIDGEEVYQSYAIRICEGPATVIQVWRDGKLVLDRTGAGYIDGDGLVFQSKALFYTGTDDQQPDPTLESLPAANGGGAGNVPAYVGTAYMVVVNDNLTQTGGRIPNYEFRMASNATVTDTCTEEGLVFWYPLDGDTNEVINGYDGTLGGNVGWGHPLSAGASASLHLIDKTGYMYAEPPVDALSFSNLSEWSLSAVVELQDAIGGSVAKNIVTYWQDEAAGYAGWGLTFDDASNNMTAKGFVGLGSGATEAVSDGGASPLHVAQRITLTWKSNDGNPEAVGTGKLYVAGSLVATDTSMPNSSRSAFRIAIGGEAYPDSYGLIGYIADVKGYNYEISATEEAIKASGIGPSTDFWELPDAPGSYVDAFGNRFTPCTSVATVSGVFLSDIELDIAARCGISASQMDVTADEEVEVDGYLVGRQMPGAAALGPLAVAYFRDFPEYDLQIHSVPRGGASVLTLTDDDFIDDPDDDELSLRQKIELPRKVNLAFSDPAANYARVIVPAERESVNISSTGVTEIELPLVLDRDAAAQKADIILKVMTEESLGTLKRKLPAYKHSDLVPSDAFAYDSKRWRIDKLETMDGVLAIEAKRDRVSNYTSAAVANTPLDPTAPVSSLKGPSVLQALNLPRLRTEHASPGMYLGCTGLLPAWPGAQIYMSSDGGLTETLMTTISSRATMGRITADCTDSSEPITLDVFDNRELASITADQALLRLNGAAITSSGTSEVIQYLDAEDTGDEWEISTIERGGLSTTAASHTDGDSFLLLDNSIVFLPLDISLAGKTLIFRAVTRGTARENNATISVVFLPQFTGPEEVEFYETEAGENYETEDGTLLQLD